MVCYDTGKWSDAEVVKAAVTGEKKPSAGERRLTLDLVDESERIVDPAVRLIERDGARVQLGFDPTQVSTTELISRLTARHAVRDLFVENPPIEEVIARLYETQVPAETKGSPGR